MKMFMIFVLFISIISCTPKLSPVEQDIDMHPGKPLYESYLPKYDSVNIMGVTYLIEIEPYEF